MENNIKVFISGDFAPRLRVNDAIRNNDYKSLFNDILPIVKDADISITNLESPLIEEGKPIAKTGPNLKSPLKSIEAIKFAGFDMVTLANNHLMDYGNDGLFSTMKVCHDNGIRTIGAGNNLKEAQQVQYFEIKNKRIAFISCCENEWSTTHGEKQGANPLDEVTIFYQIQEAKSNADYTIMIIHGGHETYEYPSLRMKKLYRWFIDLGCDAVVGHHTHCFSGYEVYKNKPIFYSLGNFIFDSNQRNSSWNIGAAVTLEITSDKIGFTLYPFTQCDANVGLQLLDDKSKSLWTEKEHEKTKLIQDDKRLEKEFDKFVAKRSNQYNGYLEQSFCSLATAAKNRGLLPKNVKGKKKLLYLNIIRTEAHRDILLKILSKK